MRPHRDRPVASPGSRRRGAVAVVVLVCLVLIALIGGTLLRTGLVQRRRLQMEEGKLQAEWLAESGLERAAARLAAAPDYRGETWRVPAADLGGRGPGTVTIAVEPVAAQPGRRTVRVQADYPDGAGPRARRRKHATVELGPGAPEEGR
jgi:Tfp pilus assembly protein PilX